MRREHTAALPRWLTLVCVLTLLLSGCVSADDAENGGDQAADDAGGEGDDSSADEPLGTSIGTSTDGGEDLIFEITKLSRTQDDTLVLEFDVVNETGSSFHFYDAISGGQQAATAHGVTLIEPELMQRFFPMEEQNGTCHCNNWDEDKNISPGDRLSIWVTFPLPPEDASSMVIDIPQAPPILDVPIDDEILDDPPGDATELAEPKVLDIYSFADDLGDGTGRSESEDETAIMLSTDVLFDTGESALTDDAEDVLEEAAAEIDDATGELVQVEGHADDTGNDAVNEPLSLERAEAVQERLEELVSRSEVGYESEGHGSADPIADNNTEEGREKNRRVTVTFAK